MVDGDAALAALLEDRFDAGVLDVLMPGIDGREVLRRLRRRSCAVPVVLLTQVGSRRSGHGVGGRGRRLSRQALRSHELVARLRAVLPGARAGAGPLAAAPAFVSGGLRLDRLARRTYLDGAELQLTPKASLLLDHLAVHPDELLTRPRLLEAVWGWDNPVGTRAVDHGPSTTAPAPSGANCVAGTWSLAAVSGVAGQGGLALEGRAAGITMSSGADRWELVATGGTLVGEYAGTPVQVILDGTRRAG